MDWGFANDRWCGPWASPNLAGSFVVQLVALSPAWCLLSNKRLGMLFAYAQGLGLSVLLFATGSRGAWVALVCLAAYAIWILIKLGHSRHLIYLSIVAFFSLGVGIALTPTAGERIRSVLHATADFSSQARLNLWKSAVILAVDHPWFGVGDFNSYFTFWYAPADMRDRYWATAINDYLHCAAVYGIPALCVGLISIGISWVGLLRESNSGNRTSFVVFHCSAALVLAWCITAFFSNVLSHPEVSLLAYCCLILGFARAMHLTRRSVVRVILLGMCTPIVLFALATYLDRDGQMPRHVVVGKEFSRATSSLHKGRILVVGSSQDLLGEIIHGVGLPVVESGWDVTILASGFNKPPSEMELESFDSSIIFFDGLNRHKNCKSFILIDSMDGGDLPLGHEFLVSRSFIPNSSRQGIRTTSRTWPSRFSKYWKEIEAWIANVQ